MMNYRADTARSARMAKNVYDKAPISRIELLDAWKGLAIIGVVVFHFAWDLEAFGLAPAGMTLRSEWIYFARSLAGSFMLIVGINLYLAHGRVIRWLAFVRRLLLILIAAFAITAFTYMMTPRSFIYFGILHSIAISSVLALIFLKAPALLTAAFGVFFLVAGRLLSSAFFDTPYLYWTGLSTFVPPSNDFEPIFPWFGLVLIGMAIAKSAAMGGALQTVSELTPRGQPFSFLRWTGRHTLAIYLVHQPILFGGLYVAFVGV